MSVEFISIHAVMDSRITSLSLNFYAINFLESLLLNASWLIFWIAAVVVVRQVVSMIRLAYFHPLSSFPGPKFTASNNWLLFSAFVGRGHRFLPYAHKYYGEVVRIAPNIVSVADKDMIKEILIKYDFPKTTFYDGLELNNPANLFTATCKASHKYSRRMASPGFSVQHLRSVEPMMQAQIHEFMDKIDQLLADPTSAKKGNSILPQGQINIYAMIQRLALDLQGEIAFGQKFNTVRDESHELLDLLDVSMKRSWRQGFNPWMKGLVPWKALLYKFAGTIVKARTEAGEKGKRSDLLQFLIDFQERERIENGKGESVDARTESERIIQSEIYTFLMGGSATPATPLTFTLMYLAENPDKLAKLREELDTATVNNAPGDLPSHDQIRNLPYLTGCINEALRLRPTAAVGMPRQVDRDVTMNGWHFPAGTNVLAQSSRLHRNEKYFPQSDKFIPERWIPDESPFPLIQEGTFYPFSAGTRACIGQNFALMQIRLVVASLVCFYDIELVKGQRTDHLHYIVTMMTTGSYQIAMQKRNSKQPVFV